jgi:signal transduction histidine kinase/PAS domain-containing protein/CheY-like chemotaxis protein
MTDGAVGQMRGTKGLLRSDGEMARLIEAYDWSTSLGPILKWPISLKTTVGMLIHSPVPIVLLWGEDGIMIYNGAYSVFAGGRHPKLLGSKVREGWPEVADFNDNVMKVGLAGKTLVYKDQELTLQRSGKPEQAWMNLDYSPVFDESGRPAGVIAIVVETTEKVLAGRRIELEQQRQKQMFAQMPGFVGVLSGPEHVFEYVNEAYVKISGRKDFVGRKVRDVFPELAGQGYFELLDRVYSTGETIVTRGMELRLHGSDTVQFIDFVYEPMRDEHGFVTGIFLGGYEVTEVHQQAAALRELNTELAESEERLHIALSAGDSIGTWDWDVPSDRVVADARFASLYGVEPERAKAGAPIAEFFGGIHPDDVRRVQAEVAKGLETGAPFTSEYRLTQPNDAVRWVVAQGRCTLSADGRPLRFSGLSFDITRRKAEEVRRDTLIKLTDRIRDLNDASELAFSASAILGEALRVSRVSYGTIDPDAETLTVDRDWLAPGVESLAGTLNLRDYGSFIDDLKRGEFIAIADVDRDWRTAPAAEALKRRSAGAFVNVPVIEQGRLVAVLFLNNAKARDWSNEELSLVQEIADRTRTATERLKAAEALRHANENLEAKIAERTAELLAAAEALRQSQKMEAIGQLTGGIAHDFNNLLTGISGSLELLDTRIKAGRLSGVERYVSAAQGSARRAATLTQRLLAFSRRQTLDPRPTDVNKLVGGIEELLRRSVGPAVLLEVVGAGGVWQTNVDPSQLENALLNLCINSRDAMPDGGRITIETANKWLDDRGAKDHDLPPGQYVSVSVSDTGTGMTPDVIAQAYEPFFTTKPLGQGTGLGLSMVQGFVRQSGGQIRIYSELGKGTTISLYLPRSVGPTDDVERHEAPPIADPGHGETVLVIDDEAMVRMLIVDVLEDAGYIAMEAADGPNGLKILQSDARIDLLITDVGLPGGMNGRQVADAARVTRPELKVLFVTGYAENAAIGNGHLEPGMQVIGKPFAMAAFANKVREIIDG